MNAESTLCDEFPIYYTRPWVVVCPYVGCIFLIDEEIRLSLGVPPCVITNSIGFVFPIRRVLCLG